ELQLDVDRDLGGELRQDLLEERDPLHPLVARGRLAAVGAGAHRQLAAQLQPRDLIPRQLPDVGPHPGQPLEVRVVDAHRAAIAADAPAVASADSATTPSWSNVATRDVMPVFGIIFSIIALVSGGAFEKS